ncbi:Protein asteroid homolog 1 [Geodia barretti]|uniref:Protein asteroid homolog 1 n=1 Tax=Geodia barretti TaxID=519541 RepID=A0AA35T4A6_GEOBA|nr:Protein asteroid homolog 1 [Geodia barretti]
MGIRSLTKFVDTHYARWERGRRVQGTLVVDGNCILHSLHTMEWSNGGQYREFRNAVCRFYSKLLESGITPIVVFDGVDEAQKIDTLLRRKREWVNTIHKRITDNASRQPKSHGRILPPLSSEVYRMALYSLDIQFYVADGEADVVTARLANYYGCPVLSQDSDFYVFRLVGGFIHFDRFYGNSRVVTADVYHRDQFTAQLCLRDTSLFCIIPAIVGNDFMVPCTVGFVSRIVCSLSNTGSAGSNIRAICRHLSHFSSVREFTELSFGGKKLELRCQKALEWYEVPDNLSCKELVSSTNLRHHNGDRFPEWLVRLFHLGRLPSSPMDAAISSQAIFRVVADNFQKESSVLAGQPIRRHMYALLEVETVVEVVRCGLTITGVKTTRRELSGVFRGVTVASIESLGHQERQSLFYEILECDKLNINLKLSGSYQDWRFVAATVSYWAKTTCPPEHLVRALLLCFMLCSGLPDAKFNSLRRWLLKLPSAFRQSQEWLDTLHWFSQWQAIYHAAWTLNALLMEPMLVFSPAFLYDGELVMYLASSGDTTERLCEVDTTLYNRLEEIVFSAQLVTPPYSASESSSDTASIEESVHSDEADLTRESPRLATASINSVDEQQGPSNAQSTHSTQVTSDKRQNMHTHQTQDTTSRHSTDEHQGVTDTQNTPSPQVECSKEQVKPKHEDMEHIGEQQKSIEHANIAWGSEAETTTVGQSAVQSGTTTPKTKRKRSRQKKAKPKTANVEVVSGTGGNTPDKRPMDSPSTAIPSAHSSAKKPSELKSPAATTMDSTNDTAHAKRKRKRSRHKKAQPTQQTRKEMTHHNRQTGNSSNPPGIDSSPLAPQPVGVQISSVQGAGAMSVADKPVQVRTQIEQGEGPATSPKKTKQYYFICSSKW